MSTQDEERFQRLADVLPVGVWMSGVDGGCTYFNRTWLELTGRPIELELGAGWLEAVHQDDREPCMGSYLGAFAARDPFTIEYRIRRHDGQYRWLLDKGVPHYDVDRTFLGYVGVAVDFTDQRNAEQALRDLSGSLIAAQEDERRRIARELHDSLSQRMALISLRLHELQPLLPAASEGPSIVASLLEESATVGREIHTLSHRLHSAKLDALGLVEAVASLCRELSAQGVPIHFSASRVGAVPSDVALCLFRITQEALANVLKHSHAANACVTISGAVDAITLRVDDDGCGFVSDQPTDGLGLVSMRERVRSVGGQLLVRSAPGQGTVIEARVPAELVPLVSIDSFDDVSARSSDCPPLSLLSERSQSSTG